MPRISAESSLKSKLKRHLNVRQNKSFLSENNVICQDRKLRGRILKPIEWSPKQQIRRSLKTTWKSHHLTIEELKQTDAILPTKNYVRDVNFGGVMTESNDHSQKLLLYKTIERLWHENLQIFIYHSNSKDFSNFIHSFPNLIAVQIKVVMPSSSNSDINQIISSKNFIFQKNSFLKMIDSTLLDTNAHNIKFLFHSIYNEEPRTITLSTKRPAIDMELEESPTENNSTRIDDDQPKPLDLRTFSQDLRCSKILNRNIVNKLQRLNTVIRRHPNKASSYNNISIPNYYVTSQSVFTEVELPKRNVKSIEAIESFNGNWQRDCVHKNKFDRQSIIPSKWNPDMQSDQIKTEMWMFYTSAIESFDRNVPLAELDTIPIETLYNPGEDFNLEDYL